MAKFKPTNMSEETNNPNPNERKLTPEDMEQGRKNLIEFYKKQNEVLVLQDKFQKLKADIAENDAKELMWVIRKAQMLQGPPPDPDPSNPDNHDGSGKQEEGGPKKRNLKTE